MGASFALRTLFKAMLAWVRMTCTLGHRVEISFRRHDESSLCTCLSMSSSSWLHCGRAWWGGMANTPALHLNEPAQQTSTSWISDGVSLGFRSSPNAFFSKRNITLG